MVFHWFRPAFSEEFEKAEEELQKLYEEYLTHVRCLDALRAQMNINAKVAQPASEDRKSSAPASMILLPDGILDFSDELSNDGDDLLDDENNEMKLKRPPDSSHESGDSKTEKPADDGARAKLRIKTGGEFKVEIVTGKRTKIDFSQFVDRQMNGSSVACLGKTVNLILIAH